MSIRSAWFLPLVGACAAGGEPVASTAPADGEARVEFGTVAWERDFGSVLDRATREDRPVLLVFQEVPG